MEIKYQTKIEREREVFDDISTRIKLVGEGGCAGVGVCMIRTKTACAQQQNIIGASFNDNLVK